MPVVWEISALHLANNNTLISGVILTKKPYVFTKKVSALRNFIKILKSYFIGVYAHKKILITSNDKTTETVTAKNGSFRVITNSLHRGDIKINIPEETEPLKILQTYPITFENTNSAFDVISDIDDTIIVSNTADLLKRVLTIAFKAPYKRLFIGFSKKMFDEFRKSNSRVIYISKSESNLFGYLTTFIEHNDLPKYPLYLTPYLSFSKLFYVKKAPDFKSNSIKLIMENSNSKKYILFGDDSQKDIEIYSEIAKSFPNRILKIYIRQTKSKILPYQREMMEKLDTVGVPVKYFKSNDAVEIINHLI